MPINRSQITDNILHTLAFIKSKLATPRVPKAPAPAPQYGQVPLPLPLPQLGDTTKLIVLFLVASITTALMLPRVIGGIKVSTARPAITMNLGNQKTVNRIFWVLVSAAAIAAITEKDWRK
ncbi:hypothetical protein QUB19_23655 [Microcoleus sp. B4-C5]|uniref:hypothetical protein n=1 Tax=unclassified Microcoleus TaxID=2642155 RepID=UPI002FD5BD64